MTQLEKLLKEGKCTNPYLRAVYKTTKGAQGWRMMFSQNIKRPVKTGGNSLVAASLAISGEITVTAIMTTNEKFLQSKGIDTTVNTFYIENNASGNPVNNNIPGEFQIVDELITADELYGLEDGATFILNIESFFANPFLADPQPVINPGKGIVVMELGPDGNYHPYYRHNELRLKAETPFENQSIADFTAKFGKEPVYHTVPSTLVSLANYDRDNKTTYVKQLLSNPYLQIEEQLVPGKTSIVSKINTELSVAVNDLLV